jgi:hypothetical protein
MAAFDGIATVCFRPGMLKPGIRFRVGLGREQNGCFRQADCQDRHSLLVARWQLPDRETQQSHSHAISNGGLPRG